MNRQSMVLGLAVAGLSVFVVLLLRQNAALRAAIDERDAVLAGRVAAEGLKPGDTVGGVGLFGEGGVESRLGFGGADDRAALVFVVSAGCEACDLAMPAWVELVGGDVAGARVLSVDIGARDASALSAKSAAIPVYGSGDPGWLREVPVTPTVLVVRGDGRVMGVWHGHRAARRADEMYAALLEAAAGG